MPTSLRIWEMLTACSNALNKPIRALFEATKINPSDATLWHNLAQSARYTMRTGEALSYFERAVELETDQSQARKFAKEVEFTRKIVASELKLRGPGFTLEQLIEQQSLFREANNLMESHHWAEAEESLRRVIDIADVLPQPWGEPRALPDHAAPFRRGRSGPPPCVGDRSEIRLGATEPEGIARNPQVRPVAEFSSCATPW